MEASRRDARALTDTEGPQFQAFGRCRRPGPDSARERERAADGRGMDAPHRLGARVPAGCEADSQKGAGPVKLSADKRGTVAVETDRDGRFPCTRYDGGGEPFETRPACAPGVPCRRGPAGKPQQASTALMRF